MDKPRPSGSGRLCLPEHPTNRTGPKNTTRTLKVTPHPLPNREAGPKQSRHPSVQKAREGTTHPRHQSEKKNKHHSPRATRTCQRFSSLPANNRQTTKAKRKETESKQGMFRVHTTAGTPTVGAYSPWRNQNQPRRQDSSSRVILPPTARVSTKRTNKQKHTTQTTQTPNTHTRLSFQRSKRRSFNQVKGNYQILRDYVFYGSLEGTSQRIVNPGTQH